MSAGRVRRVNGPLVEVEGLENVAMSELVAVGHEGLAGEVVAVRPRQLTVQLYEYSGGVAPGDPVRALGRLLAVPLGPGLLGGVFDGMLRPLAGAPIWLPPRSIDILGDRKWAFTPTARVGDTVTAGELLGTVDDAGPLVHRVQVPPGLSGRLSWIRDQWVCSPEDPVATVDGRDVALVEWWPVRRPRPTQGRLETGAPLLTGQRVLDAVFPIMRGGTASVPGGFGTGKTVLLQQIAKWCDADVIVYIGCGERGNEMADVITDLAQLVDPRTNGRLADRTVVIANTSNMPIMAREASIYTGVAVAEYYRDMGYDAVVIADSTSRWAEALREFASRSGALPAEEGYPAELASALAAFYERAGQALTLGGVEASVSIVGAVSPPGGDMTEPVTSHTQRFVRSLWTLDRDLAYGRHYPAVTWVGSYCRDAGVIAAWYGRNGDPAWARRRRKVISILAEADRLSALAELVGGGTLPGHERMIMLGGRLLRGAVLQQNASSHNDAYCDPAKTAALIDLVLDVVDRCHELIDQGAPATMIEEFDLSAVLRAREDFDADDVAAVHRRHKAVLDELVRLA